MKYYGETEARDALVTKVEAIWAEGPYSSVPIFRENGPEPNLDQLDKFMNYELWLMDEVDTNLADRPISRTYGYLLFYFGTKEGKGTRELLKMRDFVKEELRYQRLGQVRVRCPKPGKKDTGNGWHFETLMVPFFFDGMPIA